MHCSLRGLQFSPQELQQDSTVFWKCSSKEPTPSGFHEYLHSQAYISTHRNAHAHVSLITVKKRILMYSVFLSLLFLMVYFGFWVSQWVAGNEWQTLLPSKNKAEYFFTLVSCGFCISKDRVECWDLYVPYWLTLSDTHVRVLVLPARVASGEGKVGAFLPLHATTQLTLKLIG